MPVVDYNKLAVTVLVILAVTGLCFVGRIDQSAAVPLLAGALGIHLLAPAGVIPGINGKR